MPGLVPGIHVLAASHQNNVDGRDEPGHDDKADDPDAGRGSRSPSAGAPLA
jgi:hypothetical protein